MAAKVVQGGFDMAGDLGPGVFGFDVTMSQPMVDVTTFADSARVMMPTGLLEFSVNVRCDQAAFKRIYAAIRGDGVEPTNDEVFKIVGGRRPREISLDEG